MNYEEVISPGAAEEQPGTGPASGRPISRFRWVIHLALIGGYFLPLVVLTKPRTQPVLTHTPLGLIIVCGFDLILFGVVFGLALLASRATREQLFLYWRPGWWVVPLGVAYSVVIRVAVALVAVAISVVLLSTVFDQQQLQEFWRSGQPDLRSVVSVSTARSNPTYAWLLVTLVSFISAGLREELWRAGTLAGMRAVWPRVFGTNVGQFAAILLIAIAFGAGHMRMGVMAAIMAGLLGLFLGLILIIHRSVWPAVIAHGCFDAVSFALVAWLPANVHSFQ